jgi:DNA-binding NarL/FixJ family response regulator
MKLVRPHLAAMYRAAKIRHRLAHAARELNADAMTTLTPREREVIHCGLTNREIAAALVVAPGTVRTHLEHIYEKLDVGSRMAALAKLRASLRAKT